MKKNKVVCYTIFDENNAKYAEMLEKSLHHFHPDLELKKVQGVELAMNLKQDPNFFYRATPLIAKKLIKDYSTVIKLDADTIITGDISHVWEGEFDVGVVNNNSPIDYNEHLKNTGQQLTVWNVHPLSYINCGFVVMKSEKFIDHWIALVGSPHFNYYQFREQDLLNIMIFYGTYKVNFLDMGKYFHGLASKGYWNKIEFTGKGKEKELFLPKSEKWPTENKIIKAIHWGGGNMPDKMNFNIRFKEDVAKWLNKISH